MLPGRGVGAFDATPHCVLFQKASRAINDVMWRILVDWYSELHVCIKWNHAISSSIRVIRGTRQGGLSSPFLFNLFYKDLIDVLSNTNCGILINSVSFNVFCYADDILLASTSTTGLQTLINTANEYITSHGLRFNPGKTKCATVGKKTLSHPGWFLNNNKLDESDRVEYLGAVVSDNPCHHVMARVSACRRAFYALQGAGLCKRGTNPNTIRYLWTAALRPVLMYGVPCMKMSKKALDMLEKCQTKLLKSALSLKSYCRNTPLLQALNIQRIETTVHTTERDILKSCLRTDTKALKFYSHILSNSEYTTNDLCSRSVLQSRNCDINIVQYIFDDNYSRAIKRQYIPAGQDGLVDSIKMILTNGFYDVHMLHLLLSPF